MDTKQLDQDIYAIRNDISSLEADIKLLNEEKDEMQKAVQAYLDLMSADVDSEEVPNNADHGKRPIYTPGKVIDESIAKYFLPPSKNDENDESNHSTKRKKMDNISNQVMQKTKDSVCLRENLLYENIFRFGGVTAFPINKKIIGADIDVIGIRFDIFSHLHKKFLTPHYAILKKDSVEEKAAGPAMKWRVLRNTLPIFVPVEEYSKSFLSERDDFRDFVKAIRNDLIKIRYRHDKFESLMKLKYKHFGSFGMKKDERSVINKLQKDIKCERITIQFTYKKGLKESFLFLNLVCGEDYIDEVDCSCENVEVEESLIKLFGGLRNCKFSSDLIKTFKANIKQMIEKEYI